MAIMAPTSYRVVVIGAGVSGLTAARQLIQSTLLQSHELCVLEATSRVGGRVQSVTFGQQKPITIEVGAAWIHGASDENPFYRDLILPAKIACKPISARNPWLHPASCDNFQLFFDHEQLAADQVEYTWQLCELLLLTLQRYATSGDAEVAGRFADKSLADIVKILSREVQSDALNQELVDLVAQKEQGAHSLEYCVRLTECWMGSTADSLQLDDFEEVDLLGDDPGAHSVIPYGMEQVISHLREPLGDGIIQTDAAVDVVEYTADGATLKLHDGRIIQTDFVIVTCPLGALKEKKLRFEPELPLEKQQAIQRSSMGQYMKVLVEFPHVFWPEDAKFFGQLAPSNDETGVEFPLFFNYHSAKGAPVLEGVMFGDVALRASEWEDEAIVKKFVHQLQRVFGDKVPQPVSQLITRWNKHPWTVGAYSCLTLESSTDDPEVLRQTVAGRVLFAGEATNYRYQGALQAAYLSGLVAVDELETLITG
ncbi:hypothetical protein Poli38472_005509 [Pythium oligandrum]|uniref:Amine oxidase domain-containing protein n=1 Tax=Pythium oligandrum TaxID=41045 RepID=A0A8K1CHI1_PYTOL|nr:hypothetical protein Poli38472_005509 [Pythium oligandrum]|eukprot:TMW62891.1 hypothetical protein Poli38472_005509 [Pythium oligandrum]